MIWIGLVFIVILVCFSGVLLVGAPYLPTLKPQVQAALELAKLEPDQTLIELGCGDGKVLLAAARTGAQAIGYELNPLLAFIAWLRTRCYHQQVRVIWGDFWRADWPSSDVIFTFLLPRYMEKLDKKCIQYKHKPVKLVSFAFEVPGRKSTDHKKGLYLYEYR